MAHAPAYQERLCGDFRERPADGPQGDRRLSGLPRHRLHGRRYAAFGGHRRGQRLCPPPCSPADEGGLITRRGAPRGNMGRLCRLSGKRGAGTLGQRPAGIFNAGERGRRVYAGAGGDDFRKPLRHRPAGAGIGGRELSQPDRRGLPAAPAADTGPAQPCVKGLWQGAV